MERKGQIFKSRKTKKEYSPLVQRSSIVGSGPADPGSNPGGAILGFELPD